MTALLTSELQGVAGPLRELKMAQALEECKRMNIAVLPPDINNSKFSFSIEDNSIRFGLSAIKNVGAAAIDSILAARDKKKFTGFKDFLMRVDLRKVNKKTIESLVKAGAFTAFGNKATLLKYYPVLVREASDKKEEVDKGQFGLFSGGETKEEQVRDNFVSIDEFSDAELFAMEKEVIGFLITQNPFQRFRSIIDKKVNKKIGDLHEDDINKVYIFAGVVSGSKIIKTKKDNAEMSFLNIYDETGSSELVAFPKTFMAHRSILAMNKILLFKAKVNEKEGTLTLLLEKAVDLENYA